MVPIPLEAPVHSVNEAAVGSDDYAVDSVDESVGSEVGSAIDVVDGVEVEGLQILVELLIAPIFPVGSLLRQRDNCPNHLTLLLTNWI